MVVGALVPGAALGARLGRRERAGLASVLIFGVEVAGSWLSGWPLYGLSAYVGCVGRAAARVDPRGRALGARLGLDPIGDIEVPLVAAGVFGGAALAFGMQVAARLGGGPALGVGLVAGFVALAIDLQHAEALGEAGALRGSTGPVLLPHLTVREHLNAARAATPPELLADLQRRPRHLAAPQRALLAALLAGIPAGDAVLADQE